jgi:hypothetical protein
MKIKDLKKLIADLPDDMKVFLPGNMKEFDGMLVEPCSYESGVSEIASTELTNEEIENCERMGLAPKEESIFLLCPHGYSDDKDHSHEMN